MSLTCTICQNNSEISQQLKLGLFNMLFESFLPLIFSKGLKVVGVASKGAWLPIFKLHEPPFQKSRVRACNDVTFAYQALALSKIGPGDEATQGVLAYFLILSSHSTVQCVCVSCITNPFPVISSPSFTLGKAANCRQIQLLHRRPLADKIWDYVQQMPCCYEK